MSVRTVPPETGVAVVSCGDKGAIGGAEVIGVPMVETGGVVVVVCGAAVDGSLGADLDWARTALPSAETMQLAASSRGKARGILNTLHLLSKSTLAHKGDRLEAERTDLGRCAKGASAHRFASSEPDEPRRCGRKSISDLSVTGEGKEKAGRTVAAGLQVVLAVVLVHASHGHGVANATSASDRRDRGSASRTDRCASHDPDNADSSDPDLHSSRSAVDHHPTSSGRRQSVHGPLSVLRSTLHQWRVQRRREPQTPPLARQERMRLELISLQRPL